MNAIHTHHTPLHRIARWCRVAYARLLLADAQMALGELMRDGRLDEAEQARWRADIGVLQAGVARQEAS